MNFDVLMPPELRWFQTFPAILPHASNGDKTVVPQVTLTILLWSLPQANLQCTEGRRSARVAVMLYSIIQSWGFRSLSGIVVTESLASGRVHHMFVF